LPFVPSSIKILPYTLDKTQNRSDDTDSRWNFSNVRYKEQGNQVYNFTLYEYIW
jgi:hypothetical protein